MKTITTSSPALSLGDKFTIAGVYNQVPDRRWWPRLRNWVMRRPPPTRQAGLKVFECIEVVSSTASIKELRQ